MVPSWRMGRRALARHTACLDHEVGTELHTCLSIHFPLCLKFAHIIIGYSIERGRRGEMPQTAGVIPRAVADIFAWIHKPRKSTAAISVYCSFVQIYNEQVSKITPSLVFPFFGIAYSIIFSHTLT